MIASVHAMNVTNKKRFHGLSKAVILALAACGVEPARAGTDAADTRYEALFATWKQADSATAFAGSSVAVPSAKPVVSANFTSSFGTRSDPFHGGRAMHAGVDLAGPVGTPIHATADGIVDRAERWGGYGNMVELDHGGGTQTRYGHMSRILVQSGQRVHRGDVIGLMGSTGHSTGSHLHYEVRLDGHAVSPLPYLQSADYLAAVEAREQTAALGVHATLPTPIANGIVAAAE